MQSTLKKLPSIALASLLVFFGSTLTASAYSVAPLEFSNYSDFIQVEIDSSGGDEYYISYNSDGTLFNGGNARVCPVAGFCASADDGWIDFTSGLNDFHILIVDNYTYNLCTAPPYDNYEACLTAPLQNILDDFTIEYIETATTTPPIGEDKRIDNLMMFVLFWFTTFGGTVILVNKFT